MTAWPETLPQSPLLENFRETAPDAVLRTEMEQGPAKLRRRTTAAVRLLDVCYLLSKAQVAMLEIFYNDTLAGGSLAFDFTHPRTSATVSCRFLRPPQYTSGNGDFFKAALALEVLP